MRKLDNGTVSIDHGQVVVFSDFEDDGEMWKGEGEREKRTSVSFSQSFLAPPHVQVSIAMLDIATATNIRTNLEADNITNDGFEIVFNTWGDTRVARVRVAWTAIGTVRSDEQWDVGDDY